MVRRRVKGDERGTRRGQERKRKETVMERA